MSAAAQTTPLPRSYRNPADQKRRLAYIDKHRDEINRSRREDYRDSVPKVSARDLDLFRKDPQREVRLKLKYIVCRECGVKLDILKGKKGGHLWQVHDGMTAEQYTEKWPGAPLVSRAFRARKARGGRKPKPTLRGHSRPDLKIRGHIGEKPLKKSELIPLLAQGLSYIEIGKRLNRFFTTIGAAVRRMGLKPLSPKDRRMMAMCRGFLRDNPTAGIDELNEWLIEQAMLDKARNRKGRPFARFLNLALDLRPLFPAVPQVQPNKHAGGRPRQEVIRRRIHHLRSTGATWDHVATVLNGETGVNRTPDAYRFLGRTGGK